MNDFLAGVLVTLLIVSVPISFLTFHYLQSRKFDKFLSSIKNPEIIPTLEPGTAELIKSANELLVKNKKNEKV